MKRLLLLVLFIWVSVISLYSKIIPLYNSGFEVWEMTYITGWDCQKEMASGWDLRTSHWPIDIRKTDTYHSESNAYLPHSGNYALYFFDTGNVPTVQSKGYRLAEGTYTYSVYASTMGWGDTYITLTVTGGVNVSQKHAMTGSWKKYSITFTIEEETTIYLGIDNKRVNNDITYFIADNCSLETSDGALLSSDYNYAESVVQDFVFYVYSNGDAELTNCNNKSINGKVEIPNTIVKNGTSYKVRRICSNAFEGCNKMTELVLPSYLYSIESQAFLNCSSLTNLSVPNSVKSIGEGAFMGCSGLTSVNLGNNIISIGENAFNNCYLLSSITCMSSNPPKLSNTNCFSSIVYSSATLLVPYSSVNKYKTSTYWKNFLNIYGVDDSGNILIENLYLDYNNKEISINESFKLTANIIPECASNKALNWISSNPTVATVNSDGLVTAHNPGTTTVLAATTDGSDLNATCMVTVVVLASSISLNMSSLTLDIDESSQLIATVFPNNTTNKTITWKSGNTSIATVNSDGVVTAKSLGSVIITASTTDGSNLSTTCIVTVNERKASSISLNKTNLSLNVSQTAQLIATIYPNDAANKTVIWNSSNDAVATVSNNGLVTGVSAGTAAITATTTDGTNLSASCAVTVTIIPATSVSLNKTSITLDVDDTYTLVASVLPSNASYKTVSWASSNPEIATVSSDGIVTPVAPGNAVITATTIDGTNLSASCQVTIVKRIKGIALNESNLTLTLPETAQLIATITPSDATTPTLTWTSSKSSVATVDSNGFITSVGVGTTTIKATTTDGSNLSASCQVTVNKQYVTSITLNENSLVMHIGESSQLIANVLPENATNPTINWSSGNTSVARVDNNGLVTAIAGGTTYIKASATDGSYVIANCSIEVLPDYYLTLDTLSHIRGEAAQVVDLPVSLVNKNPISGIQFDVTLPNGVDFNLVDSIPDVWLDDARKTRTHSVSVSQISNGKYRVLVSSSSSKDLKGNDGVLLHMKMLLAQLHSVGNFSIGISNIIASESDETRHTLNNTSSIVHFYYIVGDADANALVDIADHAATASKILGKSPSPFYYDAANVDGNNSLDVVDLVGITNIALEIKPITIRQAPRRGNTENRLFCDRLNLNAGGEREITLGIDCGFAFAGFQMDVELPNGLTLTGATLGDDASAIGLATEMMPDGRIRILGTSFSDSEVDGNCPRLLTLKVKAERNYMPGSEIKFADILFAERDMTAHAFDGLCIEYIEPSTVYELTDDTRIYVENGNIIVDTPVAGIVQLIAIDGRMIEYQAHVGHNVFAVDASGIYIINFNGKTLKVRL